MKHKITSNSGSPVFGQLLSFVSRNKFDHYVKRSGHDHSVKRFKAWDHFVTMLFAVVVKPGGLREICSGIAGYNERLKHLGLGHLPKKSTLSDANSLRNPELFEESFKWLVKNFQPILSDSGLKRNEQWLKNLFLVDCTTITLFTDVMKACGAPKANGKKKGGAKVHAGMRLVEGFASLIRITSAATSDKSFMKKLGNLSPKTILVFDRAYVNFELYQKWYDNQIYFVTRQHKQTHFEPSLQRPLREKDEKNGVLADETGILGKSENQILCRRVRFKDPKTEKEYTFITTQFELTASQVARAYKERWAIEILFKRLKQNVNLHTFYGDNENAIRIQIWSSLIADLLITIARKTNAARQMAHSVVTGLLRMHLMHYVTLKDLLNQPENPAIFGRKTSETYDLFNPPPLLSG